MKFQYIDVHCHPNLHGLREEQDEVIQKMQEKGILGIVVGVNLESSREAVALAEKYDHLWATIGLHPNYTDKQTFDEAEFEKLVTSPKVVGIGECGLDYFRPEGDIEEVKKQQFAELESQVRFAQKHDKALMVHCRPSKNSMDAYRDFADFIEPYAKEGLKGNMHFFVGNLEVAQRFWDIGFTTSFTGVLTFTEEYNEVVKAAPREMLLTETDAPYAAPVPHRGKTNKPEYVPLVTAAIAQIRGEDEGLVAGQVIQNAERIFGIQP